MEANWNFLRGGRGVLRKKRKKRKKSSSGGGIVGYFLELLQSLIQEVIGEY